METGKLAGVVGATAVMFSMGAAPPASAITNVQVVGIEERVQGPNGTEIGYTVSKILPSFDPVAYPVVGRLYEATVEARAIRGTVVPMVPFFNARAESGANYPVLADVSSFKGAPLEQHGTMNGKIYFDAVGDAPNSVVYNNGPDQLVWMQIGQAMPGGSTDGGSGGSEGVMGSTGPNNAGPQTSGGEAGNIGEGGVEGGGGNLDTGGGSGATEADTGS
jgi:Domain of unknown function (DUF1942)